MNDRLSASIKPWICVTKFESAELNEKPLPPKVIFGAAIAVAMSLSSWCSSIWTRVDSSEICFFNADNSASSAATAASVPAVAITAARVFQFDFIVFRFD